MLTEVMRYYGLARPLIDAGFYETDHHAQVLRDVRAAILGGRLVALTAIIGSARRSCRGVCVPNSSGKAG